MSNKLGVSSVSGDFPVDVTKSYPISRRRSAAVYCCLFVRVSEYFSKVDEHDTHDLLRTYTILARILIAFSSDTSETPDFLVTREDVIGMLRGKLLPWNLSLSDEESQCRCYGARWRCELPINFGMPVP